MGKKSNHGPKPQDEKPRSTRFEYAITTETSLDAMISALSFTDPVPLAYAEICAVAAAATMFDHFDHLNYTLVIRPC